MRFKGTLALLLICAALGGYVYYYEIKGGEERAKAKLDEKRLWKVESDTIQQIDLIFPDQHITGVRTGEKEWKITAPRALDADSEELNRLASSAADMSRDAVIESAASDLSGFGLNPAEVSLQFKTRDGKEYKIRFGSNNPTGSSTYAVLEGKNEVFLVSTATASTFRKKLDDLRNRSVLAFDQFEANTLVLQSEKSTLSLAKENDRWWIQGPEKWAADSSGVNGILGALSSTKLKDFFEGNPDEYQSLGFEKPVVDVRLTVGKNKGIKHLTVGLPKSKLLKKGEKKPKEQKDEKPLETSTELYLARDEARKELFFVDKEFVDKILKSPADVRDKALAAFQRWDIDVISVQNSKGSFTFTKTGASGDWVLGDAKKKAKWDATSGILDALEKPVSGFVDKPVAPATYGLDAPRARVILKQGATVKVDCAFGKEAKDGIYAQIRGETSVKIAPKDTLEKIDKGESDFLEPAVPPTEAPKK
jgi:hypothetical protein